MEGGGAFLAPEGVEGDALVRAVLPANAPSIPRIAQDACMHMADLYLAYKERVRGARCHVHEPLVWLFFFVLLVQLLG